MVSGSVLQVKVRNNLKTTYDHSEKIINKIIQGWTNVEREDWLKEDMIRLGSDNETFYIIANDNILETH